MSIDYENSKRAWKRNKSNLTRAQNREDWAKVLEVCEQAFEDFDSYGYPDDWARFQRAREDARRAIALQPTLGYMFGGLD